MAFAATTLSAAQGANDTTLQVASLTGVAVGQLVKVEGEFQKVIAPLPAAATTPLNVIRGVEGTAQVAHPTGIRAVFGNTPTAAGTDWPAAVPGAAQLTGPGSAVRARKVKEYNAAGAITLPDIGSDMLAILNGTVALAMTLANPSTAQDGDELLIMANGKAAHTVTYTAGLGNGGAAYDVATFSATLAGAITLIAAGGFWVVKGSGVVNATAATGAPLVA